MDFTDWRKALRQVGESAITLELYVEPGASKPRFGPYDPWRQRIQMAVVARAEGGKANRDVLDTVAEVLGVPSANVTLVRGTTTRRKTVRVEGIGMEEGEDALEGVLEGGTGGTP